MLWTKHGQNTTQIQHVRNAAYLMMKERPRTQPQKVINCDELSYIKSWNSVGDRMNDYSRMYYKKKITTRCIQV